jgi:hypothetical protein
VGPLLYLYLPIVTALDRPYLENAVTSLGDLVAVVRGAQFATATGNFTRAADLLRTLVEWITGEFGLLLVLAALGTVVLAARRHLAGARVELSLLLYAATVVVFALQYPDSDPLNRMKHFLSLVVLVLLLLAHGLQALRDRAPDRRWALGGAAAVAVLVVAFLLVPSVRDSRRAVADTSSAASALAALEAVPPGTVIVTGDYDASSFLWYYLIGEGRFADKELQVAHHWRLTQVLDHLRGTGEDPLRADPPGTYRYHVGDDILAAHPPVEEGRPVYVYGIALPETPEIVATQVGDKLWRLSLPPPAG